LGLAIHPVETSPPWCRSIWEWSLLWVNPLWIPSQIVLHVMNWVCAPKMFMLSTIAISPGCNSGETL
jgi:hypothetical protein